MCTCRLIPTSRFGSESSLVLYFRLPKTDLEVFSPRRGSRWNDAFYPFEAFCHPYAISKDGPCLGAYPDFRFMSLDLFSGQNETRLVQFVIDIPCTFRSARQSPSGYRKECSALFAMIEWNVLLSEKTDAGCFLCRSFKPIAQFGVFCSFSS
jgi:hypothetical protein